MLTINMLLPKMMVHNYMSITWLVIDYSFVTYSVGESSRILGTFIRENLFVQAWDILCTEKSLELLA